MASPDGLSWEVLVVTNACTDSSHRVVEGFLKHLPLRTVDEPQRGISYARNRLVRESFSDAILWIDDDVEVDSQILFHYADALQRFPEADFFGGVVHVQFEGKPPPWVSKVLQYLPSTYAQVNYGADFHVLDIHQAEFPVAANMLTRSQVFAETSFRTDLRRSGEKKSCAGEETGLFLDLDARNKKGVWVPGASVKHWITPDRQTIQYVEKYWTDAGIQEVRLFGVTFHNNLATQLKVAKRYAIYRLARLVRWPSLWLPYLAKAMLDRGRRIEFTRNRSEAKP